MEKQAQKRASVSDFLRSKKFGPKHKHLPVLEAPRFAHYPDTVDYSALVTARCRHWEPYVTDAHCPPKPFCKLQRSFHVTKKMPWNLRAQRSETVTLRKPVPSPLLQVELRSPVHAPTKSCPAYSWPDLCTLTEDSVTPSGSFLRVDHPYLVESTYKRTLQSHLMESTMKRRSLIYIYNA